MKDSKSFGRNILQVQVLSSAPKRKEEISMTYSILEANMERLKKKLTTIQSKCKKFDCSFTYTKVGEEFKTLKDDRGVDFMSYRSFMNLKFLRKSICKEFKRKMNRLNKKGLKGQELNYSEWCSINSYKGWLLYCDSYRLQEKYI